MKAWRRKGLSLALACCLLIMTICGAASAEGANVGAAANANPGLQYFGYYHMDGQGMPDPKYLPFAGRIGNSNVAIFSSWSRGTTLQSHIDLAAANGMKVLLNVYDYFFHWSPGGMGDGSGHMHADWQVQWAELKRVLSGYEDKLLGFYFDEPWWCGVTEENFRTVTQMIRQEYPDKKLVAVSAVADLDPYGTGKSVSSDYIEFVTDVGFNYYESGLETGFHQELLEKLKAKADRGQHIWLLPKSFSRNATETTDVLQHHLLHYYKMALNEPRVVGMAAYTMPSGGDGTGMYAFMNESDPAYDPYLTYAHVQVGRSIIDPANADLYVRSVDGAGSGSAWSESGSVLKWTAPKAGTIQISSLGPVRRTNEHGNELAIKITRGQTPLWPSAGWQSVTAANSGLLYPKTATEVQAGEEIWFHTDGRNDVPSDTLTWDPVIVYSGYEADGQPNIELSVSYQVGHTANATALEPGELLVSSVAMTNKGKSAQTVTAIVALYDGSGEDGALANLSFSTATLQPGESRELKGGFKLPDHLSGYRAKTFVVSGEDIASPGMALSDVYELPAP
ncbi:hypothetical protein [Paenibacillus flagellatus]|uniref:Uncharacterized protein n=1 Tax=Paenibacillus flagellatus TaxID=2211139 RepID=A0A2V5KAK6_9BACL|nr:hypothetical protein [Paenibacillus flagellatus]PYI56619.1 hypothetical protein DLM86_06530 [Paenibacillus flagellatus]